MAEIATPASAQITIEEYLERELEAEFKSEYFCGRVIAMPGSTYDHAVIVGNLVGELSQGLRKISCGVLSNNVRLAVNSARLYTYPDVMVMCGDPAFVDNCRDTVSNPVLIIEVLSESTKDYDRGEKFQSYGVLSSLKEYLTVAQREMHVEQYVRQSDESWLLKDYEEESSVKLASFDLELQLSDIYEKIEFEPK